MSTTLGQLNLFGKTVKFNVTHYDKNGKFLKAIDMGKTIFNGTIRNNKTNLYEPQGKITNAIIHQVSKGLNLAKTPGFKGFALGMGVMAIGAGIVGYLLGKNSNKTTEEKVATVPPEINDKEVEELPEAKVYQKEEKDYHTIKTGGMSWKNIIETYYPELIDKHNGKLYGNDGAIRELKNALQECCNGNLVTSSDIPSTLNLPLELNGVKIATENKPTKTKITKTGGHTNIKEAGCKNTKSSFTVVTSPNDTIYIGTDKNKVDSLSNHYQLDLVS